MTPVARMAASRALHVLLASSSLGAFSWRAAHAQSFYDGPPVDAHAHLRWSAGVSIDDLIELYDAAGVQGAHLFGEPWPLATDACDRYPARVVPIWPKAMRMRSTPTRPTCLRRGWSSC